MTQANDQPGWMMKPAVKTAVDNPSIGPDHPYTKRFATAYARCMDQLGETLEAKKVRDTFEMDSNE